jgi:type IV pilus assembly protein PilV
MSMTNPARRVSPSCSCEGFTLVEVLVALVVLSVGLLGIAALLLNSLQGSRTALERTHAVTLAADMAERIRSNRSAGNAYDTTDGTVAPALSATCEQAASTCDAATMASNDLKRWQDAIATLLPGGSGTIGVEGITPTLNRYTITVTWTQSGETPPVTYTFSVDI